MMTMLLLWMMNQHVVLSIVTNTHIRIVSFSNCDMKYKHYVENI